MSFPTKIAAAVEAEGEYTSWNWLWTRDYGAGINLSRICVDNFGTVYVADLTVDRSWTITKANVNTLINDYVFITSPSEDHPS